MITGMRERLTAAGIPVLSLHYSSDPKKRPGTPAGDAWLTAHLQGYPGGVKSPRWRKEMELDYGALGGTRLFPDWEAWVAAGRVVVPPFLPTGYRLYGTYDHGWRHAACYLVHGINGDGRKATLWEFYAHYVPVHLIAKIINGQRVTVPAGNGYDAPRTFPGNPYAGQELWKKADPSIWAEDQQMSDCTMKSIASVFRREHVYFMKAERGGDTTAAEWLSGADWLDPLRPTHVITTACPNLIREIGLQRFKDFTPQVAANRAQPEELVDKDNDAWDSFKYFVKSFPPTPEAAKAAEKPNSFAWWRALSHADPSQPQPSFTIGDLSTPILAGQREMAD